MKKNFTAIDVAGHEFYRAIRVWKHVLSKEQIFERLLNQREKSLVLAVKNLIVAVVGVLWLASNDSSMNLQISFLSLNIPVAYVNFAIMFTVGASLLFFINLFILETFVRITSIKLFKFDNAEALTIPYHGLNAWFLGIIVPHRFFLSGPFYSYYGGILALILNIPIALLFIAIAWVTFPIGFSVVQENGINSVIGIFTLAAFIWVSAIVSIIPFLLVRIKFSKNAQYIRWNFLNTIYRRQGIFPPQTQQWVSEKWGQKTRY